MVRTRSKATSLKCSPWVQPLHDFFLPLVTSTSSNLIVSYVQKVLGLDPVRGVSKNFLGRAMFVLMRLATSLGEDIYYFLPLLYWFALPLAVSFSTAFGLVVTAGQFVKDITCLPRPPKQFVYKTKIYKIVKLENHFSTEYGLPSTHTMSGSLAFTFLYTLDRLQLLGSHQNSTFIIYFIGSFLTFACALSRLYMGVHSVYDVLFGLVLALLLQYTILIPYGESIDDFLYRRIGGIAVIVAALIWFTCFYPKTTPWSASWGTACQLFGVWLGSSIGLVIIFQALPELANVLVASSLLHTRIEDWQLWTIALKIVSGGISVLAVRKLAKSGTSKLMIALIRGGVVSIPEDEKFDTEGHPVPLLKAYPVEIPTRLMSYGCTALATVLLVPLVWKWTGILEL